MTAPETAGSGLLRRHYGGPDRRRLDPFVRRAAGSLAPTDRLPASLGRARSGSDGSLGAGPAWRRVIRSRIDNRLEGDGSAVEQAEIVFGSADQLFDLTSYTRHVGRDTTGNLLSKGALADRSRAYMKGLATIEHSAHGTDSFLGEFGDAALQAGSLGRHPQPGDRPARLPARGPRQLRRPHRRVPGSSTSRVAASNAKRRASSSSWGTWSRSLRECRWTRRGPPARPARGEMGGPVRSAAGRA